MASSKFTGFLYHVCAPLKIRNKNLCFSKHRLNDAILSLQSQMIRSWFSLLLTNGKTMELGRMKKGGISPFPAGCEYVSVVEAKRWSILAFIRFRSLTTVVRVWQWCWHDSRFAANVKIQNRSMWQLIRVIPNWSTDYVTRIFFKNIIFHHLRHNFYGVLNVVLEIGEYME